MNALLMSKKQCISNENMVVCPVLSSDEEEAGHSLLWNKAKDLLKAL